MTILAICLAIWAVSLVISVIEPSFIDIETYAFFEGLAVVMPFIIVFGGIGITVAVSLVNSLINHL